MLWRASTAPSCLIEGMVAEFSYISLGFEILIERESFRRVESGCGWDGSSNIEDGKER